MAWMKFLVLGAVLCSLTSALPAGSQKTGEAKKYCNPSTAKDRAQAVVDAFRFSWEGYYTHAFPNDELNPVTNGFSNSRY